MSNNSLDPVTITISGKHDTGRTTLASLIKMFLAESGFAHVEVTDTEPLPHDQKDDWGKRQERNRARPILIRVVGVDDGILLRDVRDPGNDPTLLINNQALADGTPVLSPRSSWIPARASIAMTCCICIGEIDRDTIVMRCGARWAHTSCVRR